MIAFPSGTVIVDKIDSNNNFIEGPLYASDVPMVTSGTPYTDVAVSGKNLETAFKDLCTYVGNIPINNGVMPEDYYGFLRWDNAVATPIPASSGYYVASGVNAYAVSGTGFSIGNNKITYVDPTPRTFRIILTGSVACASANESLRVALFKYQASNSTTAIVGECETRVPATNVAMSFAYSDLLTLQQNDYLQVRVRNLTDITSITIKYMQFQVAG